MPPPRAPAPPGSTSRTDGDGRIAKLLARAGVASRREIERMIADGRVALNGAIVTTPATVLPSLDGVTVDGTAVEAPAPARLFLYHKPAGLLVTERDPAGRPTIYDRLPAGLPRVVPVGRLDLGTEGLLLLTTDGGLKRQLELPATGVERAYRARAYGEVTQQALEALIEGVEIEGVRYGSIDANLERRTGANVWIELVLTEGKNREVRRVLEYLGLQVSRLIRTRYGPFVLGDLTPGAVGEVRAHDIASFRKNPTRLDLPQPARQRAGSSVVAGPRPVARDVPAPQQARPVQPARRPAVADRAGPVAASDRGAGEKRRAAASPHGAKPNVGHPVGQRPRSAPAVKPAGRPADVIVDRANKPARSTRRAPAGRPTPGRADAAEPIARPARAARARAFRETREADNGRTPTPPRNQGPVRTPTPPRAGSPAPGGSPRGRPPAGKRPPRSR